MASTFPTSIDNFTDPLATSPLNSPSHSLQHANLNDAVNKIETYMGLVVVKTQAVGTTVSSVSVTNAFSATYDNYQVQWQGGAMSGDTSINMTLTGAGSTSFYSAFMYGTYQTAVTTVTNEGTEGVSSFRNIGGGYSGSAFLDATLYAPFISGRTTNIFAPVRYTSKWGTTTGLCVDSASITGFTISPASGTMTGGTIVIYGYRKA